MFEQTSFLYVEDDVMSRQVMEMLLVHAMQAQHVTIFEDSTNFIERLHTVQPAPNLILLDIHVRPFDGFQMLQMIRRDAVFQKHKVIALTASVMSQEVAQLRESGFDGVIAKPVSVQTFPSLIKRVLAGESVWHIQ